MKRFQRTITFGIRREQKGKWERRASLIPEHVAQLLAHPKCSGLIVQPSSKRIFSDLEYQNVGARLDEDLSKADFVLGIKEVAKEFLIPGKAFCFFSHTHKGQRHNMPMLQDIVSKRIHLMDYELLVNDKNERLVAFGRHAGNAGMINILHGLGQKMISLGYSTPFVTISRALNYNSLQDAKDDIRQAGKRYAEKGGLPTLFQPVVFGFTGSGNVSQGAQEVFQQLPHKYISLKDLHQRRKTGDFDPKIVYGVALHPEDYLVHKQGRPFNLQEYFMHGKSLYDSTFHETVLPYITCLVHGAYWDPKYPRMVTVRQMDEYLASTTLETRKFQALADISCDLKGALEFMDHPSTIDEPFYHYNLPSATDEGVMIMSIDNLPAELSLESSHHFSKCLTPLLEEMLNKGSNLILERATIAKDGKIVPRFQETLTPSLSLASASKKKVLLLGSGRVALPLIDHFSNSDKYDLHVASNSPTELQSILKSANSKGKNLVTLNLDFKNESSLNQMIQDSNVVISFLPASLHPKIARVCIAKKKNLVTASYVSPEIAALDEEAKKAGIVILNELGLDPGIDHLLAMKFIDKLKQEGGKLTSFVSWCGGLPAPENSDNPLGYKFSWSPRGVLTAASNPAMFKRGGEIVKIKSGGILDNPFDVDIYKGFNFEGLPNRDSLNYAPAYGLDVDSMQTMFRGTLRYKGFSRVVSVMRNVGLLDTQATLAKTDKTWTDVLVRLLKTTSLETSLKQMVGGEANEQAKMVAAFEELGFLSCTPVVGAEGDNQLDALAALLESRLKYAPGERDMVCLHHTFETLTSTGSKETHTSSLVAYGDVGGYTAMAKTVATPAAYGAELLLEGRLDHLTGVVRPMSAEIYEPILSRLATNLTFQEIKK